MAPLRSERIPVVRMPSPKKILRVLCSLTPAALLAGCDTVVLNPSGDVAAQQAQLVIMSTLLMLLIIVPVIALTFLFAWRYRASNTTATYKPDWDHSIQLELVIWAAPLLIIIALGAITWISTHTLDPYRPLRRIDEGRPIPAGVKPLDVEVVALDWKWLFIYPEQGIAIVNELAAPVDVPIQLQDHVDLGDELVLHPRAGRQIYAMPGMETKLHAVINRAGEYEGFSANYSGAGFSGMRFKFHGLNSADFEQWVQAAKGADAELSREGYLQLEKPSEREPVRRFSTVAPGLYGAIVNRCVEPGKMCMREMMAIDAAAASGWRASTTSPGTIPPSPAAPRSSRCARPRIPAAEPCSLVARD